MNKIIKIFLSVLLISAMFVPTVFAEPMSEQLQKQQNKLQQDKSSLKTLQNENQSIETNIENLDNQIEDQMLKITQNKIILSQKQLEIKNTELEIQKTDIDIAKGQELLNARARAMYINGSGSYVSILLSSKDFGDLLAKIDMMKKLIEFDNKTIKNLNDKKIVSNNKKDILKNDNKKLLELNSQGEAIVTQLNKYIANQKSMIGELKSKEFALSSNVDASQTAVNATLRQIAEIRNNTPKIGLSRGTTIVSSNNVVAYASNFLGTPYVWGGTSPSPGFDCSGFTQYVYAHFGIRVGRTTYDQIKDGVSVARSDLQAGDLVFFGTNGPTHMGMYVGNGTYIHAPRTGDVIKISSVNRSDYITARRVK